MAVLKVLVLAVALYSPEAAQLRAGPAASSNVAQPHVALATQAKSVAWQSGPGRFASDCGPAKRPHRRLHSRLNLAQNPGVGMMGPDGITPYETVFKDDFKYVDCAKDELFAVGDKFGDGKFNYKVEDTYNVSIIHYADTIPSEDQELMSQKVCFEFCRTVPGMSFFGLTHGRDCYCAPFFHAVAGDSSACDLPCTGSSTPSAGMCGGESKSALFSMHMCSATGDDLLKVVTSSSELAGAAANMSKSTLDVATAMQVTAEEGQETFGAAGDPVASQLMQESKAWAGKVMHAAEALEGKTEELNELITIAGEMKGADLTTSDAVKEAEALMAQMVETSGAGAKLYEVTEEVYKLSTRGKGSSRAGEYYPLMYFVDKEYEGVPSTCGGTWDGKTVADVTLTECAAACDETKVEPDCSGFFFHKSICLLFSKFKSVTYYTGCKEANFQARRVGEQSEHGRLGNFTYDTGCFAKLEDFVNTDLSPDPTGKNKLALRDVTKADRCY
jgi:hypothetical protein